MLKPETVNSLLAFRREREWEQFHTPQNLAAAVAVEAGELLQEFQWMTPGEVRPSAERRDAVELEVADIAILLTYLLIDLGIDLDLAVCRKLELNERRYPVSLSKGNARKYDALQTDPAREE